MSSIKNQSILNQVEKISSAAAKCSLDFDKLVAAREDISRISEFLEITTDQAILFACMAELSLQRTVTLDSLARHLRCSALKIINIIHEIEALERKSYILKCNKAHGRKSTYTDFGYIVPFNVIESLRTADKSKLQTDISLNLPNFLEKVHDLIYSRTENAMNTNVLFDQVEFMILNNAGLPFLQFLNKNSVQTVNKCIVFALAYFRFKREGDYCIESVTQALFDDLAEQMEFEQNFAVRRNELFKNEIIEFRESQFMNEKTVVLTPKTLKFLYKDYPELNIKNETDDTLFKYCKIKGKNLYFADNLQKQIDNITTVLDIKNFHAYRKKLERRSLPGGITIIFYGTSGTGKTEAVYQIAKKTRRDILLVDLSQLRSKWFGESEKTIKKLFDDYRRLSDSSREKPILFINEADGMFAKRTELKGNASSVDQTLNTIQNIILQELEVFQGILFATTNLSVNLDSAFERRFLFKVEFTNPVPEAGKMIWMSRLPELTEAQSELLATKYCLSGGEIENIARKYIIDNLTGSEVSDFEKIIKLCEREKPFHNQNKIGFRKK